jgi:hypothetical protein
MRVDHGQHVALRGGEALALRGFLFGDLALL